MTKKTVMDTLGWGFILWLIGYVLGIIIFMVNPSLIGWILTPLGTVLVLWVLWEKIGRQEISYYVLLSVVWTLIAMVGDYLFIVKAFGSTDYYKLDVYLYYSLTFVLPLLVGWLKTRPSRT